MREKVFVRKSVKSDIQFLADHIRIEDKREIEALGCNAFKAFEYGHKAGSYTGLYHGVPMAMFGTYKQVLLSDNACIWMLGTRDIDNCSREMLTITRKYIDYELNNHKELFNYVDARYKKALKWLRVLGFSFSEPLKAGINGEIFYKISIGR